jgi:hypothetical protein
MFTYIKRIRYVEKKKVFIMWVFLSILTLAKLEMLLLLL